MHTNEKVMTRNALVSLVSDLREEGEKIVTCNGTFDLLHAGHIAFLEEAKTQGDVLIVAVNADASVKRNKGENRPLNTDIDRARVLGALACVDYVTLFEEDTPIELLKLIKPDVHVNGSDYGKDCVEAATVVQNGGKIYIVPLVDGYSTTSLIEKMH